MRVATWNVLHRIHAMNWSEPAIAAHPDEAVRLAAIAARVAELGDVVCLQEVSGDQLALLRALPGLTVIDHLYPRVPRQKIGDSPLADPSEHLVTVTSLPVLASRGLTFDSDRGKGLLIVELAGVVVINTHVSYGAHHAAQCSVLTAAAPLDRVVIAGDFNCDPGTGRARFGAGWTMAVPAEPSLPTRPRTVPSDKSQTIDHIFVKGLAVDHAAVLDGGGLSDHNPVVATLR